MENELIKHILLKEIENKLKIGPISSWSNNDYETLSKEIFKAVKLNVSSSTLKRMTGYVKGVYTTRPSTIDALALYLGYKGRFDFINKHNNNTKQPEKLITKSLPETPGKTIKKSLVIYIIGITLSLTIVFLYIFRLSIVGVNPDKITLEATVLKGELPFNTTVSYNIRYNNKKDFTIKGESEKFYPVSGIGEKKFFFRHPGLKKVSIYYKNKEVKSIHLFVYTDGWIGFLANKEKTMYTIDEIQQDGYIQIPDSLVYNYFLEDNPAINYEFSSPVNISLDNMNFETRIQYHKINGYDLCCRVFISLTGEHNYISVPLTHKTCDFGNYLHYDLLSLKNNEYSSKLHWDENEWSQINIIKNNDKLSVFKDSVLAYTIDQLDSLGKFLHMKIKFVGGGKIDYVKLQNLDNEIKYFEDF